MVPAKKQQRRYKLASSAFKMIPFLYNTLLANEYSNFSLGLLPILEAHQTQQP
jgi:hypothetical protein